MIYQIESTLDDRAMEKMQENISKLIEYITEHACHVEEINQVVDVFRYLPFQTYNWIDHHTMDEFDVSVCLSNKCKIIFNIKDVDRDIKINNILKK